MLNKDSIVTVVFSQPSDPTPQPLELDNILQLWVTGVQMAEPEASQSEQLPIFKLDLDQVQEA